MYSAEKLLYGRGYSEHKVLGSREYFHTRVGYQQRFLKLRASFTVNGGRSPRVLPVLRVPVGSQVDHWFDGEAHSGFHRPNGLVFGVMRDIGRGVEQVVDTMTGVGADHRTAISSCNRLNGFSDITK